MSSYDHPFYKRLVKNDLPITTHQGGPAIPVALRKFFPPLPSPSTNPTEEFFIRLDLIDGSVPVGSTTSRWHFQTWGKKRKQETRLTQNIAPLLLKSANVGDYLVFEREIGTIDSYRVTLLRQGTAEHAKISPANPRRAWGPVRGEAPSSLAGLADELADIQSRLASPLVLFEENRARTPHQRLLRDGAFSRLVKRAYEHKCAWCGNGFIVPSDDSTHEPPSEPEAAHIVPVGLGGADDPRNGLSLCRTHHWLFDRGLGYVTADWKWAVSERALKEPLNGSLESDNGILLTPPKDRAMQPSADALAWHREKVALR